MSPRTRSFLLLVLIMTIGILLGILLGGRLYHKRMDHLRMFGHPEMVKHFMLDRLELDPDDREELDSLLDAHARETSQLIRGHRELMKSRMDSLLRELREHLGPEQYERLEKAFGERKSRMDHRRPPRGRRPVPPAGGPGGEEGAE